MFTTLASVGNTEVFGNLQSCYCQYALYRASGLMFPRSRGSARVGPRVQLPDHLITVQGSGLDPRPSTHRWVRHLKGCPCGWYCCHSHTLLHTCHGRWWSQPSPHIRSTQRGPGSLSLRASQVTRHQQVTSRPRGLFRKES